MSDVQNETGDQQQPPATDAATPAAATSDDDTGLASRVSSLESRVTTLEQNAAASGSRPAPTLTETGSFDAKARADELVAQGMSEQDAVEQAAYEERLWNDRRGG